METGLKTVETGGSLVYGGRQKAQETRRLSRSWDQQQQMTAVPDSDST